MLSLLNYNVTICNLWCSVHHCQKKTSIISQLTLGIFALNLHRRNCCDWPGSHVLATEWNSTVPLHMLSSLCWLLLSLHKSDNSLLAAFMFALKENLSNSGCSDVQISPPNWICTWKTIFIINNNYSWEKAKRSFGGATILVIVGRTKFVKLYLLKCKSPCC